MAPYRPVNRVTNINQGRGVRKRMLRCQLRAGSAIAGTHSTLWYHTARLCKRGVRQMRTRRNAPRHALMVATSSRQATGAGALAALQDLGLSCPSTVYGARLPHLSSSVQSTFRLRCCSPCAPAVDRQVASRCQSAASLDKGFALCNSSAGTGQTSTQSLDAAHCSLTYLAKC